MKKSSSKGLGKVIWSMDAFEGAGETQTGVARAIEALADGNGLKVEAVYVLSPDQLDLPVEFTKPWVREYRPAAEQALKQRLQDIKLKSPVKSKVLLQTNPSVARSVEMLSKHARATGADMIVVGTHGREGLSRILLGSFAESLVMDSRVPVLTVKPGTAHAHAQPGSAFDFKTILFPTDFSRKSLAAFRKLLAQAKSLGSKVLVLHSIPNPVEPVFQSGVYLLGGGWVPVPMYLDKLEAKQRDIGRKWVDFAKRAGVPAELVIETGTVGVVDSILGTAKSRKVGMIAMSAQSGKVAAALLGSVTRKVVRQADCPVWVYKA